MEVFLKISVYVFLLNFKAYFMQFKAILRPLGQLDKYFFFIKCVVSTHIKANLDTLSVDITKISSRLECQNIFTVERNKIAVLKKQQRT